MNDITESTCWYKKDLYKTANTKMGANMNSSILGQVLKNLFEIIPKEEQLVLDIGCGNAKVSTIISNRKYTGLDLSYNIETMCETSYSNLNFIKCNIIKDNISFISKYNIILLNAFIDVMNQPIFILDKILNYCTKYIIIHRQEIVDTETQITTNASYNGYTHHSELNRNDFNNILKKNNIIIVKEVDAGIGVWKNTKKRIRYDGVWRSFLLKREL